MADSTQPRRRAKPTAAKKRSRISWAKIFLSELAATSNVSAAARKAGVSTTIVYEARRTHAEFNREWRAALCEGYDALEMALLHRLREGEVKPAPGAKRGVRSFDNATALRLLAAHRDTVVRERAMQEEDDADAILAAIDAKLDRMRERSLTEKEPSPDGE